MRHGGLSNLQRVLPDQGFVTGSGGANNKSSASLGAAVVLK